MVIGGFLGMGGLGEEKGVMRYEFLKSGGVEVGLDGERFGFGVGVVVVGLGLLVVFSGEEVVEVVVGWVYVGWVGDGVWG